MKLIMTDHAKNVKKATMLLKMESAKSYRLIVHNVTKMINALNVKKVTN